MERQRIEPSTLTEAAQHLVPGRRIASVSNPEPPLRAHNVLGVYPSAEAARRYASVEALVEDLRHRDVEPAAAGSFGEPESARPRAQVWFAFDVSGPGALALALAAREAALERESSLPEIGELGRAERRAKETVAALRAGSGAGTESRSAEAPGVPDWMRGERERLLESGIDCGPWPLSHLCRCGARLEPFLFGSDPSTPYDAAEVDDAAIAGLPFRDPSGELAFGFNCDACGRLHTWILGVSPPSA